MTKSLRNRLIAETFLLLAQAAVPGGEEAPKRMVTARIVRTLLQTLLLM